MSGVEKRLDVLFVRTFIVLVLIMSKSLPALILQVLVSFVNSKTIHKLLSEKTQIAVPPRMQQQGRRPLVDLPIQWLERYGLPHGKKVSSVDANICIATSPLTLEVTSHMDRLSNGHIDEHAIEDSESATSV